MPFKSKKQERFLRLKKPKVYEQFIKEGKILYKPFVAPKKSKHKYKVYVKKNNKIHLIGFGHKDYQHYKDKLGYYKRQNHLDKKRRDRYRTRASKIRNKKGQLTYRNKNYANFWAYHYLW